MRTRVSEQMTEWVRAAEAHLGRAVTIERTSSRLWTMSAGNDRVRATGLFRVHPTTGRTRQEAGTILLDGVDTRMHLHWAPLRRLLEATDVDAPLPPAPAPVDDAEIPAGVVEFRDEVVAALGDARQDVDVAVGRVVDGSSAGWEIVLTPDREVPVQLRVRLPGSASGSVGRIGPHRAVVLIRDGLDLSELVGSDLSRARALLTLGGGAATVTTPRSVGHARAAEVNTSVQVRRHSVRRV